MGCCASDENNIDRTTTVLPEKLAHKLAPVQPTPEPVQIQAKKSTSATAEGSTQINSEEVATAASKANANANAHADADADATSTSPSKPQIESQKHTQMSLNLADYSPPSETKRLGSNLLTPTTPTSGIGGGGGLSGGGLAIPYHANRTASIANIVGDEGEENPHATMVGISTDVSFRGTVRVGIPWRNVKFVNNVDEAIDQYHQIISSPKKGSIPNRTVSMSSVSSDGTPDNHPNTGNFEDQQTVLFVIDVSSDEQVKALHSLADAQLNAPMLCVYSSKYERDVLEFLDKRLADPTFLADSISLPLRSTIFARKCNTAIQLVQFAWQTDQFIGRGNKYKKLFQKQTQDTKLLEEALQKSEAVIHDLEEELKTTNGRRSSMDMIETPMSKIENQIDILLENQVIKANEDLLEQLQVLRRDLRENGANLFVPSFKQGDHSDALTPTSTWLRTRFSDTGALQTPRSSVSPFEFALPKVIDENIPPPSPSLHEPSHACFLAAQQAEFSVWDWDLDELLPTVRLFFEKFQLFQELKIPSKNFDNFLQAIHDNYQNVTYHNIYHAISVCQWVYCALSTMGASEKLSRQECAALMISALAHDLNHPGFNNAYLVEVGDPVAMVYNDSAVLENMHTSLCFKLLNQPKHNIFEGVDQDQERKKQIRHFIIKCIMSTDMARHFEFQAMFAQRIASSADDESTGFDTTNDKDRLTIASMLIKCADISNVAKPWDCSKEWAVRANKEFFNQGDVMREKGLPVPPHMDRTKITPDQNSANFIDFVAGPLFKSMTDFLPSSSRYYEMLTANRNKLRSLLSSSCQL